MTAKHKKDHEADTTKHSSDAADRRIAELEEQVKTLTTERQDFFDKLQRVSADYINYQNRAPKQIAENVAYEKKALIRTILPVLDNLSHAAASAAEHGAHEAVVKGIQLVFDHMVNALRSLGAERIIALGSEFDPNFHEAVMQRTDEELMACFQRGDSACFNLLVWRWQKAVTNFVYRFIDAKFAKIEIFLSGRQVFCYHFISITFSVNFYILYGVLCNRFISHCQRSFHFQP